MYNKTYNIKLFKKVRFFLKVFNVTTLIALNLKVGLLALKLKTTLKLK